MASKSRPLTPDQTRSNTLIKHHPVVTKTQFCSNSLSCSFPLNKFRRLKKLTNCKISFPVTQVHKEIRPSWSPLQIFNTQIRISLLKPLFLIVTNKHHHPFCLAAEEILRPHISEEHHRKDHHHLKTNILLKHQLRRQQGSNLRGRSPTDFKSVSLTTRTYRLNVAVVSDFDF